MPTTWRSRALIGLAVAATVFALVFVMRALSPAQELTQAPYTPTPTPTVTAEPIPQPGRFSVRIVGRQSQPMDTARIYGRDPQARPEAVRRASNGAAKALERYLNQAFVQPRTRFSDAAYRGLLTSKAADSLSREDQRALGAHPLPLAGGITQPVQARAIVLQDRGDVVAVSLRYRARMAVLFDDGTREPLVQRGAMVFVRAGDTWRADMVDVRLRRPQARRDAGEESP